MKPDRIKVYPIGLMPKVIWQQMRMKDIREAIDRYTEVGLPVSQKWVEEYNELAKKQVIEYMFKPKMEGGE